jgi:DNA polymerase I-like protein with 3'-5' exonuclease and polymerase domains
MMYPTMSYEDILETAGTNDDRYTKGKQGFFASILYGGNHLTLARKLGVNEEDGKAAIEKLLKKYRDVNAWRVGIAKAFQSMTQPEGLGKRIYWNTPPDYCESFLGFRRYYTLENKICEALYTLARKLPKEWQKNNVKCVRSNRVQYATGAVSSALFGAAFGLQSANVRSAANHQIQSPGAQLTKRAQRLVWDLQPSGVGKWCVAPMQIHDEIVAVTSPEYVQPVADCINSTVESFKEKVPLIGMTWKANVNSWGDK